MTIEVIDELNKLGKCFQRNSIEMIDICLLVLPVIRYRCDYVQSRDLRNHCYTCFSMILCSKLWPFFALCMFIFHKTEVLMVILRCLTGLNLNFLKYDSWFSSEVSKRTSARNMLHLPLKYRFMEAKIVYYICHCPQK